MSEPKTTLRHLHGNVYEDVTGGLEPLFEFVTDRGEVQFWHQSGYGYLPASRVEVLPADGVGEVDRG